MKRSKHEIISEILKVCLNGASKTRIVYQANLNFKTVDPYLRMLIQNNLLETDVGEHTVYRTTKQGVNLEETISHVNQALLLE